FPALEQAQIFGTRKFTIYGYRAVGTRFSPFHIVKTLRNGGTSHRGKIHRWSFRMRIGGRE
ncbi:MAG TPA: hypothetical protein PLP53_07845, partial [Plasticicumulans sp.]|nr:hypothetical protein [Plasticicumulans sp.]